MSGKRIAVVTGASSGVGRAAAQRFAMKGYDLGLIARGEQGLRGAEKECSELGARVVTVVCDVSDPQQLEDAADRVEDGLGEIDVWVNNAMVSVLAPVWEIEPEEFQRVTDVTYMGTVHGTMTALRRMKARDSGVIVNVGSALAYRAIPLQAAYCGAKHAIEGFTESLRTELMHEKSGVKVCMVQLPALNTPQFEVVRSKMPNRPQPVPPIYQPEVAADSIVWIAENPRREITVGASAAVTVAVNKFIPGLLDRYLGKTGFDSQQTDEPALDRPDNLFEPFDRDLGSHGRFDHRSYAKSPQLWLNKRRRAVMVVGAVLAAGAAMIKSR